jgi:thiol-disulfide isomerase/thioredoxin
MGNSSRRACRFSVYVATLAGLLFVSGSAFAQDSLLHKPAPSFIRNSLSGQPEDLSAYRGKVVLLNFWATWCAPCQLEMPRFAAWQKQYGTHGLQIVGVSMDDEPDGVRKLVSKMRINYPVVMGDEQIGTLYGGILGLPVTFLIDRQGQVSARFQGETDLNAMEEQIKQLLASR